MENPTFPPPNAARPQVSAPSPALRLSIERKIGMYGSAYDGPLDARAYTYQHQPANQPAWKLGRAVSQATSDPAGDYIDAGLALLRRLEDEGFGVFALVADEVLAPEPHPDDLAVDRFAAAMKAKLAQKRAEGFGGWEDKEACSNGHLSQLLVEHVHKGDPVDIGNLAMMLHQRGEVVADDRERYVAKVQRRRAGEWEGR